MTTLNYSQIKDIQIADIDMKDFPKFCDAFIESASYGDREMTEDELEVLNEDREFVYWKVIERIY